MIELWNKSRERKQSPKRHVMSPLSQSPKSSLLLFSCVLFIVTHPTSLFNSFAMQKPYKTKNKQPCSALKTLKSASKDKVLNVI